MAYHFRMFSRQVPLLFCVGFEIKESPAVVIFDQTPLFPSHGLQMAARCILRVVIAPVKRFVCVSGLFAAQIRQ